MTNKRRKSRSPNLSAADVDRIVAAIGSLRGPVTWDAVIAAAAAETKATYTRHSFLRHERIVSAYKAAKHGGSSESAPPGSRRSKAFDRVTEEVAALRKAIWKYEELFIIILANAYALNIGEDRLFAPLPVLDSRKRESGRRAADPVVPIGHSLKPPEASAN